MTASRAVAGTSGNACSCSAVAGVARACGFSLHFCLITTVTIEGRNSLEAALQRSSEGLMHPTILLTMIGVRCLDCGCMGPQAEQTGG